jgi:hypothetical protein
MSRFGQEASNDEGVSVKRLLVVLALGCLLVGAAMGTALAAGSSTVEAVTAGVPAPAPSSLAGWDLKSLGLGSADAAPLLEGGRLIWPFSLGVFYGALGIRSYDVASGATKTLPAGVSLQQADLQGDHLAYVTSDNGGAATLGLLTLSTDQTVTVSQGSDIGGPQIRGDLVIWSQSTPGPDGRPARCIYAYSLSTGKTRVLIDHSVVGSDPWQFWAGERRVVFAGDWDQAAGETQLWALEISSGRVRALGLDWPDAVWGDDVFYQSLVSGRNELHRLDLATGVDTVIVSGGEYQGVVADGEHVAWASWEDGAAYLVVHDLADCSEVRIPAPSYDIGNLRLQGDLLIWLGVAGVANPNNGQLHSYVFAYDADRGTVTRLANVFHYPAQWATDGASVAFTEERGYGSALRMVVAVPSALPAAEFSDVPGTDPYRTAVLGLRDAGVVAGYPRSGGGADFRPDAPLTRAQFAKMLAVALQVPVSEDLVAPFTDLGSDDPAGLYPHDYIAALAQRGILQGTSPGHFSPDGTLSRAQMVTLVVRALEKLHPLTLVTPEPYWDGPTLGVFDPVHGPTMARAEWNSVLDGLVGFSRFWDPWAPASRAEAAQALWNIPATRLVPEAKAVLAAALGVDAAGISAHPPAGSPPATDTLLKWQGGEAWLNAAGRITRIMQDEQPAGPSDTYLSTAELETRTDHLLSLMGWDADALAFEGLRPDPSGFSDQSGTHEFVKTWTGYASPDVQNGGIIEVRLDARDGTPVLFHYERGAGVWPVDLSHAISRDDAVSIARTKILAQSPDATLQLESATLKLTDAPAIANGEMVLIWLVVFSGRDPSGAAAGGWVYVDAYTGEIRQFLVAG